MRDQTLAGIFADSVRVYFSRFRKFGVILLMAASAVAILFIAGAALALVYSWYLSPHFVVDMAARLWSCL